MICFNKSLCSLNPRKYRFERVRLCRGRFAATNYLNKCSSKLNFKKAPGF